MSDPRARILDIIAERRAMPFIYDTLHDSVVSYGAFRALAAQFARSLAHRGISQGDRVALVLPNSVEFAALYLACLFRGAVAVPVSAALSSQDFDFILAHAGIALLVASEDALSTLSDRLPTGVGTWSLPIGKCDRAPDENEDADDDVMVARLSPDDLFSLTFTSGTTSRPKGVLHRIGSLLDAAEAFAGAVGLATDTRMAHLLPMGYMAGFLNTLLCPLMAGGSVVLCRPFDNQSLLRFWQPLIDAGANAIWLTPTIAAALLRMDRSDQGARYCREHLRTVCVGTAPLPPTVKRDFENKYGVEMLESYGLSELLFVSTERPGRRGAPTVGEALPGVEIESRHEDGSSAAAGEDCELWVRTPYLMDGYLDDETGDAGALPRDHWFGTGDLGRLEADGRLRITGRRKDLIIRGGLNISPRAVEDVLLAHADVEAAAVVGLPDALFGERVAAAVILKNGRTLDDVGASLNVLCRDRLSAAAIPESFVAVDRFPLSISGKVQKHVLRDCLLAELTRRDRPAPR